MFKFKENKNGSRFPENKCGDEFHQMFSSFSEFTLKTDPSDISAAIAQMDSIIHHRTRTHFLDYSKKSTDFMQQELHICENLGRVNNGEPHKDYLKEMSFKDFGNSFSGEYLKADDDLFKYVIGSRERYFENRLVESGFSAKSSNPLNREDGIYKNGAGNGSYNVEPQCDDVTMNRPCLDQKLSWSQHFIMNSIGNFSPLNLSNIFRSAYPNQACSVDTNPLSNGSMFYSSQSLVEVINPVCNGSLLYPNCVSSESNSVDNCSMFCHSNVDRNHECNGSMDFHNQDSSLGNSLNDLSMRYNRGSSVENLMCTDPMLYVNLSLSVQNPVCNDLMFYSNQVLRVENSLYNDSLLYPYQDLRMNIKSCYGLVFTDEIRAHQTGRSLSDVVEFSNYSCSDRFILKEQRFKCVAEKGLLAHGKGSRRRKKKFHNENVSQKGTGKCSTRNIQSRACSNSMVSQTMSGPLFEFRGYVYIIAKDKIGCRFLKRVLQEGNHQDIQIIFNETINHMAELIVDPFANHLIQILLGVCSEEQITQIVFMVTARQGKFVEICFNTHGTLVVQKLIKILKTRQQKRLVVLALQTRFLELVKDANGYHIIKSCLQFLSKEETKFIFGVAAKCHVGCCILKSCIAQSVGIFREKLVTEIASEGFDLAQDAFGNYVIQHIIELNIPSAAAILSSQFRGNYVYLSMQKFSSYVVQTFLKSYEKCRPIIIQEFLSGPYIDQLLQDSFANYVIQTAIDVSKGPLHDLLVEAVQSHSTPLSSPYCEKIFLGNLLKK